MKKLGLEHQHFFSQICALAFVNPFSEQRELEDCKLLNIEANTMEISQRSELIQILLRTQLEQL